MTWMLTFGVLLYVTGHAAVLGWLYTQADVAQAGWLLDARLHRFRVATGGEEPRYTRNEGRRG